METVSPVSWQRALNNSAWSSVSRTRKAGFFWKMGGRLLRSPPRATSFCCCRNWISLAYSLEEALGLAVLGLIKIIENSGKIAAEREWGGQPGF